MRNGLRALLWSILLAIHAAAIPALVEELARGDRLARAELVLRVAFLVLAAVFCGLKAADVRRLRLRPGWRSTIAASLIVVMLHVHVIKRAQGIEGGMTPQQLSLVLFAGTLLDPIGIVRMLRRVVALPCRRAGEFDSRLEAASLYCRVWELALIPRSIDAFHRDIPPRAPPFTI